MNFTVYSYKKQIKHCTFSILGVIISSIYSVSIRDLSCFTPGANGIEYPYGGNGMRIKEMILNCDKAVKVKGMSSETDVMMTLSSFTIQPSVTIGSVADVSVSIPRDTLEDISTSDGLNIDWLNPYD